MKLLKSKLPTLRAGLPLLQRQAAEQVAPRIRGKALQYLRRRVLVRDGYLCQCPLCQAGTPLKLTWVTAEVDHIVPLYRGGTNQMTNLRSLHVDCHARITAEQAQARYQGWQP